MGVKGLLNRVRNLEEKRNRLLRLVESVEALEEETRAGIEAGRYCPDDMPVVLACMKKWILGGTVR